MLRKPIHPFWGILEITGFSVLFFSGIWLLGPAVTNSVFLIYLFWILVAAGGIYLLWFSPVKLHGYDWEEWGWNFSLKNSNHPGSFKNALPVYLVVTLAGSSLLVLYVILFAPELFKKVNLEAFVVKFGGYLVFGTVQSLIFFGFMMTRLKNFFSSEPGIMDQKLQLILTVFITAAIFSLFHHPNTHLMGITFLAGLIWAVVFFKKPNILLLGASHAIVGTILHQVVQLHMRIGPFYDNPDLYLLREVVPGLKELIGDLF